MKNCIEHPFIMRIGKKFLPKSIRKILHVLHDRATILTHTIRINGFVKTYKELLPVYSYNLVGIFFSIPTALFIFMLMPIIKIRLVRLLSERIGHFALNTELLLCAFDKNILKKKGENNAVQYFFYTHRIVSNKQLLKMWKRLMPVLPFPVIFLQVDKILSFFSSQYRNDPVKTTVQNGRWVQDRLRLLEQVPQPHLIFTPEEEKNGVVLMEKLGISPQKKYVCFVVRDSSYLEKIFPLTGWSYHAHRNADVTTYKKAVLFLAENGYHVVRMGKHVANHFNVEHPHVIDYANHSLRCDFLDIYLSSRCEFFMSTSTGLDAVPQIFRRHLLFSNISIRGGFPLHGLLILKKIKNKKTGKFLMLNEMREIVFQGSPHEEDFFVKNHLELLDNTKDEIMELVQEMDRRVTGMWQETEVDREEQKYFLKMYCFFSGENVNSVRVKIGRDFFKNNFLSLYETGVTDDIQ